MALTAARPGSDTPADGQLGRLGELLAKDALLESREAAAELDGLLGTHVRYAIHAHCFSGVRFGMPMPGAGGGGSGSARPCQRLAKSPAIDLAAFKRTSDSRPAPSVTRPTSAATG